MGNDVLYVPKIDDPIINEAALRKILGGFPGYPNVG